MNYKTTTVYVIMRSTQGQEAVPVAVFTDLETAEGNAEGYNLSMQEQGIEGLDFYVNITALFE